MQSAEYAASQLYNALLVNGKPLSVNWAKPKTQGVIESGGNIFDYIPEYSVPNTYIPEYSVPNTHILTLFCLMPPPLICLCVFYPSQIYHTFSLTYLSSQNNTYTIPPPREHLR